MRSVSINPISFFYVPRLTLGCTWFYLTGGAKWEEKTVFVFFTMFNSLYCERLHHQRKSCNEPDIFWFIFYLMSNQNTSSCPSFPYKYIIFSFLSPVGILPAVWGISPSHDKICLFILQWPGRILTRMNNCFLWIQGQWFYYRLKHK